MPSYNSQRYQPQNLSHREQLDGTLFSKLDHELSRLPNDTTMPGKHIVDDLPSAFPTVGQSPHLVLTSTSQAADKVLRLMESHGRTFSEAMSMAKAGGAE